MTTPKYLATLPSELVKLLGRRKETLALNKRSGFWFAQIGTVLSSGETYQEAISNLEAKLIAMLPEVDK